MKVKGATDRPTDRHAGLFESMLYLCELNYMYGGINLVNSVINRGVRLYVHHAMGALHKLSRVNTQKERDTVRRVTIPTRSPE
jgi:hypothetical protein